MSTTLKNLRIQSIAANPYRQGDPDLGATDNLEEEFNIILAGLPASQVRLIEVSATEAKSGFYGTVSCTVDSDAPLPITAGTDGDWVRKQVILLDDEDMYTHQTAVNAALSLLDPATTYTFSTAEEATGRFLTVIVWQKTFTP